MPVKDLITIAQPGREYTQCKSRIDAAVQRVMGSGRWIKGDETRAFEEEFAAWLGIEFALGVGNGTDALELCLRSCGVGADDEVLTVANAGGYATTAIELVGARPVYVDVRLDDALVNPAAILDAITPRTAAMVVTHLYGNPVDVRAIQKAVSDARRPDILIIEDCAQAHGARMHSQRCGTLGDMAAFSFYPTKNLGAMGDAGMVVTRDADRFSRAKMLHQYGWKERYHAEIPGGRNSRMDEIQAAILRVKLEYVEPWNAQRQANARALNDALPPGVQCLTNPDGVVHQYVVRCAQTRQLADHLSDRGVQTDVHYPVLDCDSAAYLSMGHTAPSLPDSRALHKQILSLPCHPHLTQAELQCIHEALKTFDHKQD